MRRLYANNHLTTVAQGGKNIYGVTLGILVLESRFPRIPGDVGNADTWPFPVQFRIVKGATPSQIVRHLSREIFLRPFLDAALELQDAGVNLITTGCGFLVLLQDELQRGLNVPILTSSLLQVPWVAALLPPGQAVGVLTVELSSLSPAHLAAAGIAPDLPALSAVSTGTEETSRTTYSTMLRSLTSSARAPSMSKLQAG